MAIKDHTKAVDPERFIRAFEVYVNGAVGNVSSISQAARRIRIGRREIRLADTPMLRGCTALREEFEDEREYMTMYMRVMGLLGMVQDPPAQLAEHFIREEADGWTKISQAVMRAAAKARVMRNGKFDLKEMRALLKAG